MQSTRQRRPLQEKPLGEQESGMEKVLRTNTRRWAALGQA